MDFGENGDLFGDPVPATMPATPRNPPRRSAAEIRSIALAYEAAALEARDGLWQGGHEDFLRAAERMLARLIAIARLSNEEQTISNRFLRRRGLITARDERQIIDEAERIGRMRQ